MFGPAFFWHWAKKDLFQLWTDRTFLQWLSKASWSQKGTEKEEFRAWETEDDDGTDSIIYYSVDELSDFDFNCEEDEE